MSDYSQGGYDLDDAVNKMLTDGVQRIEGDAICRGSVGRHPCHDRMHYKVRAEYGDPPKNGS